MASLRVKIELAGAEEIKRQLEGVGDAGEEAFDRILKKAEQVGGFNKLDPSVVTQTIEDLGVKGPEAIGKITQAVKAASRMETLVNALTKVENGLAGIQSAALALGQTMLKGLVRQFTSLVRLLPLAFAASTIAAIAATTQEILRLSDAALKAGVSVGELAKAEGIFKALGASSKEAASAAADFQEQMTLKNVKQAIANLDEFGRSASTTANWHKILTEAAKGQGEASKLAQEHLKKMGQVRISGPEQDIDKITKSAGSLSDKILAMLTVFQNMGNTTERNRLVFANFDSTMAGFIIRMLDAGVSVADIKQEIAGMPGPTQAAINAAALLALEWEKLKQLFTSGLNLSPEMVTAIAASLGQIRAGFEAIGTAVSAVNSALLSFFSGTLFGNTIREINTIINLLGSLGQIGFAAMKYIELGAVTAWQTTISWINKAIEKVKSFFSMGGGQAAAGAIPDAGGFARGGLMGGRGSGTSDSNLAWLSRGEHVMPAYAVRQPGVLQLLEALRRSGGNLRGVLDRMGHFALGGVAGAPAFAGGGMNHVTIAFPGLQPIGGLRASSAVVDELRRAAALAQVRSGGRKPSRYS